MILEFGLWRRRSSPGEAKLGTDGSSCHQAAAACLCGERAICRACHSPLAWSGHHLSARLGPSLYAFLTIGASAPRPHLDPRPVDAATRPSRLPAARPPSPPGHRGGPRGRVRASSGVITEGSPFREPFGRCFRPPRTLGSAASRLASPGSAEPSTTTRRFSTLRKGVPERSTVGRLRTRAGAPLFEAIEHRESASS